MAVGGCPYLVSKAIKTAKVVGFETSAWKPFTNSKWWTCPVTVAVDAGGTSATSPARPMAKRIASGEFKGIEVAAG